MKIIFLLVVLGFSLVSHARLFRSYSYEELREKSDVVLIATPVESTKDLKEMTELPDLKIKVIGVETKFRVGSLLKGKLTEKNITLHHYRIPDSAALQINGPMLVSFDVKKSYLLFLTREKADRFIPTGGQTDPGYHSVSELQLDSNK